MKLNELRSKALVEYLATFWADCVPILEVQPRPYSLPIIPTVYILLNDVKTIVRVGQTNNLRRRIAQHTANPKVEKLQWTEIAWFQPQIAHIHTRLQVEAVLTALAVPRGNGLIALRRKLEGTWREVEWSVRKARGMKE